MKTMKKGLLLWMPLMAISFHSCKGDAASFAPDEVSMESSAPQRQTQTAMLAWGDDLGEGVQEDADAAYQAIMRKIAVREKGQIRYPDYFGGAYLTPNDKLVVHIKGDMAAGKRAIRTAISDDHAVVYESCEFSYQELEDLMERLNAMNRRMPAGQMKELSGYGVMLKENRIQVDLLPLNDETIALFKRTFFDHPAFIFAPGYKIQL